MPLQRACDAENQVRNKLSNGPLRVQSNARMRRVFCNVWAYVSCRGYVGILLSARAFPRIQGGTADCVVLVNCVHDSSLIDGMILSRAIFILLLWQKTKGVFLLWEVRR